MLSTISSRAPLGIAAAAVVAVVVLGAVFINRSNDQPSVGGPAASASPGPAATPELLNLVDASLVSCPGITDSPLCLEPGTYQLGSTQLWPAIVTLAVPENWWYYEGGAGQAGVLVQTKDAVNGSGWGVIFTTVGSVSVDPCDAAAGIDRDVQTPAELYDLINAWPGFDAGSAEPISNGYDGLRFTLTSTKTIDECRASIMWTTANSQAVDAYPMVNGQDRRHEIELRVFDVDGDLLVIDAMNYPETSPFEEDGGIPFDPERHVDHQVEMDAILDSIELKSPDGGSS